MFLDPDKLDAVREIVDTECMEFALERTLSRSSARGALARHLGYYVSSTMDDETGWFVSTGVSDSEFRRANELDSDESDDSVWKAIDFEVGVMVRHSIVGANETDVETAQICRLLDASVPLQMDEEKYGRLYPESLSIDLDSVWRPKIETARIVWVHPYTFVD